MVLTGKHFSSWIVVVFFAGAVSGWQSISSDSFRTTLALAFPVSSPLMAAFNCTAACCVSGLGVSAILGFLLALADHWRQATFKWISAGTLLLVLGFGSGLLAQSVWSYFASQPLRISVILASVVYLVTGFVGGCCAESIAKFFPDSMLGGKIE